MIKTSDLMAEIKRIQKDQPDVEYSDRLADILDEGDLLEGSFSECVYVANLTPACIVGVALHNLGVSIDRLYDYEDNHITNIDKIFLDFPEDFEVDSSVVDIANIQRNQDSGKPWGEC